MATEIPVFFRAPRTMQDVKAQTTAYNRGLSLIADGYEIEPLAGDDKWFAVVHVPAQKCYLVNIRKNTCDCEFHKEHKDCKHAVACRLYYRQWEAEMAWMEEQEFLLSEAENFEGIEGDNNQGWNW